ncbi:MAG: hypothetical protein SNJ55_00020 [Chloroherpetonaceae bacterium]
MSESESIDAYRQALERTIAVRKARLKSRKQMLKSELNARLTPKGIVSRFPVTTMAIAVGIGWLTGRVVRALVAPEVPRSIKKAVQIAPSRSRASSPLIQSLKEIAFQALTNFALNKTREFLVSRLENVRTSRVQNNIANISKPSSAKP